MSISFPFFSPVCIIGICDKSEEEEEKKERERTELGKKERNEQEIIRI